MKIYSRKKHDRLMADFQALSDHNNTMAVNLVEMENLVKLAIYVFDENKITKHQNIVEDIEEFWDAYQNGEESSFSSPWVEVYDDSWYQ